MVMNVSSLGRSGLHDWVIQRVSAVIIASYVLFLFGFLILHSSLSYEVWLTLFSGTAMKIFTLFALISLCLHAWIGLWTVSTDYIKVTSIRIVFQLLVILASIAYLAWGILILWG